MRVVNEVWTAIGFAVEQGEQQRVSPEGFPMLKPDGSPDMEPTTVLVFVHQREDEQWIIRVPFGEDSKQKLLSTLTSGVIVVAGPADLPKLQ